MFDIFRSTKRLAATGLLQGMTGVHSHLLPGIDDGAKALSDSLCMLTYLQEMGVSRMFLTPHVMADLGRNKASFLKEQLAAFEPSVPQGMEVRLAAEYMLDAEILLHLQEGLLSYDGKHVLVETSYLYAPPNLPALLYEMTMNGYTPVLAHPERYRFMEKEDYRLLKQRGCRFQLNLLSLGGYYGKQAKVCSEELLSQGLYDFVGSDIHNMRHKYAYENFVLTKKTAGALRGLLDKNQELGK